MTYAADTSVPVDRSRTDIEKLLVRYGAHRFAYGWEQDGRTGITFALGTRQVRILMALPDATDRDVARTPTGLARSRAQIQKAVDQAARARWRALFLIIKAKLVAVDAGITTIEDEFLGWTVLPNGRTVAEEIHPGLDAAYSTGQIGPLIPLGPDVPALGPGAAT